jgi:integrase
MLAVCIASQVHLRGHILSSSKLSKTKKAGNKRQLSPEAYKWLPYDDFPLSPHLPSRRWYKKILGRRRYFGHLENWQEALNKYLEQRDDLYAGREPRPVSGTLILIDLVEDYLADQWAKVKDGKLERRTFDEYRQVCDLMRNVLGDHCVVEGLKPEDFAKLRARIEYRHRSPHRQGVRIQEVRQVFKWGADNDYLGKLPRYGGQFKKPRAKMVRQFRNQNSTDIWYPHEIRQILGVADIQLTAKIFLGLNCAFGNKDCALLPESALNFDLAFLDFPRPKTQMLRHATLWPETVRAIQEALKCRPEPERPEYANLIFLTRTGRPCYQYTVRGNIDGSEAGPDQKTSRRDLVGKAFQRAIKLSGVESHGRSFYTLRHTFATIASETGDQKVVDFIMGHVPASEDIGALYRKWPGNDHEIKRLRRVTDHVRRWFHRGRHLACVSVGNYLANR